MKKIKWIIGILTIALIILIVLMILLIKKTDNGSLKGDVGEEINYIENQIEQVTNNIKFYTVNNCVSQYLNTINKNNSSYYTYDENDNYIKIVTDEEIRERIYNLLSEQYIRKHNITLTNIDQYVDNVTEKIIFVPLKMNTLIKDRIEVYSVYGLEQTLDNQYVKEIYMIVNLDRENKTFSIEPMTDEGYKDINEIQIRNENDFTIEKNEYNEYIEEKVDYEYISKKYIDSYKKISFSRPDIMYELLNQEYREKRFGNLNEFKQYIKTNAEEIQKINLQKYQVNNKQDYLQYVCVDQNGRYYIFYENAVMDYEVMLDTYTIDLPEFLEKYNKATDSQKVLLNIQKIFEAINAKDYQYVYQKLDHTFKQNNFPTLQNFETYIKQELYGRNSIGYSNYKTSGNLHIYQITIKDEVNENNPAINKNFIMQLSEGTDFTMSFNVK